MYQCWHSSSTSKGKCIICGKVTGTYLHIADMTIETMKNIGLVIPTCDEHYNKLVENKEIYIEHLKLLNKLTKKE